MSDRIERLAKEYAEKNTPVLGGRFTFEFIKLELIRAFRAGAAAGAAEHATTRSEPEDAP